MSNPARIEPGPNASLDSVVIRFAGDSGDGMQLIGNQFTRTSALAGNDLATLPDYPAEIRAPAGTRAGVSGFQIQFANHDIFTPGDIADVLVAMNPAALIVNIADLKPGGLVVANTGNFGKSDLKKARLETNPLEDGTLDGFRVIEIDINQRVNGKRGRPMPSPNTGLEELVNREYEHGFYTDIEADTIPPGLNEDIIRIISAKKNEPQFMLDWRLKAYRHWLTIQEPRWAKLHHEPIDYQAISYYSAPKQPGDGPKSLEEVDPKLLETYEKLGIPLHERAALAGGERAEVRVVLGDARLFGQLDGLGDLELDAGRGIAGISRRVGRVFVAACSEKDDAGDQGAELP